MILHKQCKEEQEELKVRFIAFLCESTIFFDISRSKPIIQTPFKAEQVYNETNDLFLSGCQATIYCSKCKEWRDIKEFEFFSVCSFCGKRGKNKKLWCKKVSTATVCWECIKKICTENCGGHRGLCEVYRTILYKCEEETGGNNV